jgi:hypothetical protein
MKAGRKQKTISLLATYPLLKLLIGISTNYLTNLKRLNLDKDISRVESNRHLFIRLMIFPIRNRKMK